MSTRNEAINHIIMSSIYWTDDNVYSTTGNCPGNVGIESAFGMAVGHVKKYHYPELSDNDIQIAKKRLGLN